MLTNKRTGKKYSKEILEKQWYDFTMRKQINYFLNSLPYILLIALLACVSLGLFVIEIIFPISETQRAFFLHIDLMIGIFFCLDFVLGILFAHDRKKYIKNNWISGISSIPLAGEFFQSIRILKILRVIRSFRAFRAFDIVTNLNDVYQKQNQNK